MSKNKIRKGIIGHALFSRWDVDGLRLKVSRKFWYALDPKCDDHDTSNNNNHHHHHHHKLYILPLSTNVTAFREFMAICRVDRLPLLDYILAKKKNVELKENENQETNHNDDKNSNNNSISNNNSNNKHTISITKEQLLDSMGGKEALGKGFAKYIGKKFNTSQLSAISASASEYGDGGFTLIKGPPGTGKTTTLVSLVNSLHIRQYNRYFEIIRKIFSAEAQYTIHTKKMALSTAAKAKPRLLICAPSNAAVDNIILKIMESGFMDGNGYRYNPSMIRVGKGQSLMVKDVSLQSKVDSLLDDAKDITKLQMAIECYKVELIQANKNIVNLMERLIAIKNACDYPLSKEYETRIHSSFDKTKQVYFLNHKDKSTSLTSPPPPEPGQSQFHATAMPEYKLFISQIVKAVEKVNSITTKLEKCSIQMKLAMSISAGTGNNKTLELTRQELETHILDSTHIVLTTLGTAGSRIMEATAKFEVVVIDEAAQSVEPATLAALQLGSSHAILVGDPQQLPATIFSVSGRNTKYDRSLFQRLEEAGHKVYMLNTQYRMHPAISSFPRNIFYEGLLKDGPNVQNPLYGNPLSKEILSNFPAFKPLTILDLDSSEERGGTSLSNSSEVYLALHLYQSIEKKVKGLLTQSRVAVITPYSQQVSLLKKVFSNALGNMYESFVEINTVDAFQGRESNVVIYSCVRAAGCHGIGFLSDVRRMNVALTRAKHFLFVIARCDSLIVNPYWRDFVSHARKINAVVYIPHQRTKFPDLNRIDSKSSSKPKSYRNQEPGKSIYKHKQANAYTDRNSPKSSKPRNLDTSENREINDRFKIRSSKAKNWNNFKHSDSNDHTNSNSSKPWNLNSFKTSESNNRTNTDSLKPRNHDSNKNRETNGSNRRGYSLK